MELIEQLLAIIAAELGLLVLVMGFFFVTFMITFLKPAPKMDPNMLPFLMPNPIQPPDPQRQETKGKEDATGQYI